MKTSFGELLGEDGVAGPHCPDPNVIAAYAERTLTSAELRCVETHLAECGHCRQEALFASIPDHAVPVKQEAPVTSTSTGRRQRLAQVFSPPGKLIGFKVAVKNALGALESVFEGSLELAALTQPVPATVFRGGSAPEVEGVNSVVLGPYRLSLKRVEEGPKAGLYVRVTKTAGMPLPDAATEIELESGQHVSGRTDKLGWVHIAGIALEHIAAIWICASA